MSRHLGHRLAVALVGCGSWAESGHLAALSSIEDVEVIGCVGAEPAEAAAFAARHGLATHFASIEALLGSGRADVVVVAAPDHVHEPAVRACLDAATPVFCEKPLANTVPAAEALVVAQERSRTPATVGFSFRYSPALARMRRDLAEGRIGEVWLVEVREHNSQFHPRFGKRPDWKADPARAGAGALFEYGSHALDLAQQLAGPIEGVAASLSSLLAGGALDDLATVQARHVSGASGVVVCGWALAGGYPGISIRIHGSEGAAELELAARHPGGERYARLALDGGDPEDLALPDSSGRAAYLRRHLADFFALVRGGAASVLLPSLGDGADVQRVLAACLDSVAPLHRVERPAARLGSAVATAAGPPGS